VWLWLVQLAQDLIAWTKQLCLADQARSWELTAALPAAAPGQADRPPRPPNHAAARERLAMVRRAVGRVRTPASTPRPDRLTRAG